MTGIESTLRFQRCGTNGIALHVAEAGPSDGPVVMLLHGFPEFWYGWRHQVDALAGAGYRVVMPDQRGYNLSDRPAGVAAYDLDVLARDIIGLADGLGAKKLSLIGHDWGASVGWWIASRHPERLDRFAALNAPHPAVWMDAMRNDPQQRRKSWYVYAFRLPALPELMMRQRNFQALAAALRDAGRPDACSDADLAQYRAAWAMPGALTGMVNWYRALLKKRPTLAAAGRIAVPCRILWGRGDKFAVPDLAERSAALCAQASVHYLDASHWVQHDEPQQVNELLLEFLGASLG